MLWKASGNNNSNNRKQEASSLNNFGISGRKISIEPKETFHEDLPAFGVSDDTFGCRGAEKYRNTQHGRRSSQELTTEYSKKSHQERRQVSAPSRFTTHNTALRSRSSNYNVMDPVFSSFPSRNASASDLISPSSHAQVHLSPVKTESTHNMSPARESSIYAFAAHAREAMAAREIVVARDPSSVPQNASTTQPTPQTKAQVNEMTNTDEVLVVNIPRKTSGTKKKKVPPTLTNLQVNKGNPEDWKDKYSELIETMKTCTEDNEEYLENTRELIKKHGIHTVVKILQLVNGREEDWLAQLACAVLITTTSNAKLCNQFVKKGATRAVMTTMHKHCGNAQIMGLIIEILERAAKKEKRLSLLLRLEGGIPVLLNSLKQHGDDLVYLQKAGSLLSILSFRNANNVVILLKEGSVEQIFGLIKLHLGEHKLLIILMSVLYNLSRSVFIKSYDGCMEQLFEILEKYSTNESVVKVTLSILKNLSNNVVGRSYIKKMLHSIRQISLLHSDKKIVLNLVCSIVYKISPMTSPIPKDGFTYHIPSIEIVPEQFTPQTNDSEPTIDEENDGEVEFGLVDEEVIDASLLNVPEMDYEEGDEIIDGDGNNEDQEEQEETPRRERFITNLDRNTIMKFFPEFYNEEYEVESNNRDGIFGWDSNVYKGCKEWIMPPPQHPGLPPRDKEFLHVEDCEKLSIKMMLHDLELLSSNTERRIVYDLKDGVRHRQPDDLQFESRFECGNLRRVQRIGPTEYDVITNVDVNCVTHTQWFYFRVTNMTSGLTYKFNIINMEKPSSEYNSGMMPLFYSKERAEQRDLGWTREGFDICYYKNQYMHHAQKDGKVNHFHTLTFRLAFPYDEDECYLACCYPYTATMLKEHLLSLEDEPNIRNKMRRTTLCKTMAGNSTDLLTITTFPASKEVIRSRPVVVLTSRVHPGESQASTMMQGCIDFLLGDSDEASWLRDRMVFKVIPMLNMDGVVEGNHRCSLSAVDLNRQWIDPSPKLHPEVFHTKQLMMHTLNEGQDIKLFVDLHGHFRKKNIFMFGCNHDGRPDLKYKEAVFPFMLSRIDSNFNFDGCSFKIPQSKKSCGRVVGGRSLNILNSFTMEASFSGMDVGTNRGHHLDIEYLLRIGHSLIKTLYTYTTDDLQVFEIREMLLAQSEDFAPLRTKKKAVRKKSGKKKTNNQRTQMRTKLCRARRQTLLHQSEREEMQICRDALAESLQELEKSLRENEMRLRDHDESVEAAKLFLQKALTDRAGLAKLLEDVRSELELTRSGVVDADRRLQTYDDILLEDRQRENGITKDQPMWISSTANGALRSLRTALSASVSVINRMSLSPVQPRTTPQRNRLPIAARLPSSKRKFIDIVEEDLQCPISKEVMDDPVLTADGHTYERSNIVAWFQRGNRTSPVTNAPLDSFTLIPNRRVKSMIETFKDRRGNV
ncbi:hypothetical protein PROFUN_06591 [Planoprotostelium fungivorum]|uniref:Uncharacterized protein n=1 Tax=Planoprotostelium fungivorum TaxID=1890364 RepID=A0A2P6MRY5_9EUKA|nr:hypothetical protein PROFUN_06591 [Planoprotostelium fungivorum]